MAATHQRGQVKLNCFSPVRTEVTLALARHGDAALALLDQLDTATQPPAHSITADSSVLDTNSVTVET